MSFHPEPSVTISARFAAVMLKHAGGERFLQRYRGFGDGIGRDVESVRRAASVHARSVANATLQALATVDETHSDTRISVTVIQAAGLVGITPQGVRKAIAEKRLPARKVGRQWMITANDLDDFKTRREHDA